MKKLSTAFPLALPPKNSKLPAYRWLYDSLRVEILSGRLRPRTRLPSTRDLARQYGLARGTIVNAFDQLRSEGYVEGSTGSGTYVSRVLPEGFLHVAPIDASKAAKSAAVARALRRKQPVISNYGKRVKPFHGFDNRHTRAFRANLPALDLFPTALWTTITLRCLRRISMNHLLGCAPLGYPALRGAIAEYLTASRGVRCVPEQIAIVSGVQEALDLAARLLVNPGDRVCVENPGYPGAALAFRAFGANIARTGVDDAGLVVRQLPSRGVRLVYVTPGHQFPLGTTMSLARRLELLEWARKSGAVIFEDDYDSEYRYSGRPIPALQGLASSSLVLYAGSFSKVLFPSLRLGYVVVPQEFLNQFEAILSLTSRHAPLLEQLVLTEFITEGHFARHLRRMREIYAERLSVMLEEARAKLAGLLEISNIEAGLQTVGWLADGLDANSIAAAAAAKFDLDLTPLSRYFHPKGSLRSSQKESHSLGGPSFGSDTNATLSFGISLRTLRLRGGSFPLSQGLQLGFAAINPKEIRRGIASLALILEAAHKSESSH